MFILSVGDLKTCDVILLIENIKVWMERQAGRIVTWRVSIKGDTVKCQVKENFMYAFFYWK